MRDRRFRFAAALGALAVLAACATSPTGRNQLILVEDSAMDRMGTTAFAQIKASDRLANDPAANRYVRCVAEALVRVLPTHERNQAWEVVVIDDDSPNAFALPGGKVGVHTGLFKVATTQDQLAAVIGHEMGHMASRHAAERVSQQFAAETALQVLDTATSGERRQLLGLLGVGAQAGVLMPFSRQHEVEADVLGQRYMALAGFNPNGAAEVWENMVRVTEGNRPPAWLSTHPDPVQRARSLRASAPGLMPTYQQARAAGRAPNCR